jgi:hypothetical protein
MSLQAKDLDSGIDLQDIRETPFQTVDLQFAVLLPNFQSISLHAHIQHFCPKNSEEMFKYKPELSWSLLCAAVAHVADSE